MAENVFRVTIIQQLFGQQIQNVLHFSGPSADPLQLDALAQDIEANWIAQVRFRQHDQLHYTEVRVRLLESQFPTHTRTVNVFGSRSFATNALSTITHVLRLRGNIIGRHGRGRVHIGGIPHDSYSGGFLESTTLIGWNNQMGALMAAYGPGGTSPFRIGITRKVNPTANFVDVIAMAMNPVPGTMRRRNIGVGI